eukprot:Lankesteria_metandrocarpae@DN4849_c0_g1_i2.p2
MCSWSTEESCSASTCALADVARESTYSAALCDSSNKKKRYPFINKPSCVQYGRLRFVILDAPNQNNVTAYAQEMKKIGVTDWVRTCELTYDETFVAGIGIRTHDLAFSDGLPPPDSLLKEWVELVRSVSASAGVIAVHCIAGLGRAPLLVAIALIESGLPPEDAVEFVRCCRRGAINKKQIVYLESYARKQIQRKRHRLSCFCS